MQNQIQVLIDQIDAPIFVLERSADDRPIYVALNAVIRRTANLGLDQVHGKTAAEIYPGKFGELAYKYHCECLQTGVPSCYELTIQLKGKETHIKTSLSPEFDERGNVVRIVGTANFANAEFLIREAERKHLALNMEIEQIIGLSAHDLRSPMRNMGKLTEILREDFVDLGDGKLEIVKLLQKVSDNTSSLIGNILNFAQTTGAAESIEEFRLVSHMSRDILDA